MEKRKNYLRKLRALYLVLIFLLELSLVTSLIASFFSKNYTIVFISLLLIILVPLPYFFRWRYKVKIPLELEIISVVFIYATIFLGEIQNFYIKFWWWDSLLHGLSAIIFGFIGFIILYFLYARQKVKSQLIWLAVFTFSFALSIGALWEIFEFFMDFLFGLNMQKSGIVDTMTDLIVDAVGAFLVSVSGFFYLKNKKSFFLRDVFEYFIHQK